PGRVAGDDGQLKNRSTAVVRDHPALARRRRRLEREGDSPQPTGVRARVVEQIPQLDAVFEQATTTPLVAVRTMLFGGSRVYREQSDAGTGAGHVLRAAQHRDGEAAVEI